MIDILIYTYVNKKTKQKNCFLHIGRFWNSKKMKEMKIPVLFCVNYKNEILFVDVGYRYCKRSYLGYLLGISPKWKPLYKCSNPSNTHVCKEYTPDEISNLRLHLHLHFTSFHNNIKVDIY